MVGFSMSINIGVTIFTSGIICPYHRNPNLIFSSKHPAAELLKAQDRSDGGMGSSSLRSLFCEM